MPLSKVRQAEYQKARRMRLKGVIPTVIPNIPTVIPNIPTVIPGLIIEGNRVVGVSVIPKSSNQVSIPLYNPALHRAGDTVRVLKGNRAVVVTIPELDADGQAIWT